VPQIAPAFGVGQGNVIFDGPGEDEDFGLEQISGDPADRYKFRTSPLRNVALQAAFFHNGSFTRLEDAIRFHLDASSYAREYDARAAEVDLDLTQRLGPIETVLDRLDPLLLDSPDLSADEFRDLVEFVRNGLLDPRASKHSLCQLVPKSVPSGLPTMKFESCPPARRPEPER
jgi:cytochrome c peroxidase